MVALVARVAARWGWGVSGVDEGPAMNAPEPLTPERLARLRELAEAAANPPRAPQRMEEMGFRAKITISVDEGDDLLALLDEREALRGALEHIGLHRHGHFGDAPRHDCHCHHMATRYEDWARAALKGGSE